jgi:hypothetical protein
MIHEATANPIVAHTRNRPRKAHVRRTNRHCARPGLDRKSSMTNGGWTFFSFFSPLPETFPLAIVAQDAGDRECDFCASTRANCPYRDSPLPFVRVLSRGRCAIKYYCAALHLRLDFSGLSAQLRDEEYECAVPKCPTYVAAKLNS